MGLRLPEANPDETTILNFAIARSSTALGHGLFEEINAHLESQGLRLTEGTIMDASIIEATPSTKNMKLHIGVDSETGMVHSVTTTAANAHDVTEAHRLLHGGETRVWGDAGWINGRRAGVGRRTGRWRCGLCQRQRRRVC